MGIMTTIFVIITTIIFITIIGFRAQGRSKFSGTVLHPKVQTLSNRTPNQHNSHGRGRSRPQLQGEPTPQGTTGGEGVDTMGWGRGGLAALHHTYVLFPHICIRRERGRKSERKRDSSLQGLYHRHARHQTVAT